MESSDVDALQTLLRDTVIRNARVVPEASETGSNGTAATSLERSQGKISSVVIEGGTAHQKLYATSTGASGEDVSDALLAAAAAAMEGKDPDAVLPEDLQDFYDQVDAVDSDDEAFDVVSFEIKPEELENVQSRCIAIEYPLIAEYDFRNDKEIRNVPMAIKPTTVLRPYQEKALRKMFGRGRSRSGVSLYRPRKYSSHAMRYVEEAYYVQMLSSSGIVRRRKDCHGCVVTEFFSNR